MKSHRILICLLGAAGLLLFSQKTHAASLVLRPASGTFTVGSTFTVSLILNTSGQSVNAVHADLVFPPDKLQVVAPSSGQSIIGVWTAQPKFNNANGTIEFQGGIPGGINVSEGTIATITFRAKQVGSANVRFGGNSQVLLNDGLGTDVLTHTSGGLYTLVLPPPAGPQVVSETHPDQTKWYADPNALLKWTIDEAVQGFSYVLDREPVTVPDNIAEGTATEVFYRNLPEGIHYFHIKALRNGLWGGVTHFALRVDTSPPADFPIEVLPFSRTTRRQPVIQFSTTDALSGISHYELKLVPLNNQEIGGTAKDINDQPFFIEAVSPWIPFGALPLGSYDVIVRAYDHAGNEREVTQRIEIVTPFLNFISGKGVEFRGLFLIPWTVIWFILAALLVILGTLAALAFRWHKRHHMMLNKKGLPEDVARQIEELKKYKEKYGGVLMIFFFIAASFMFLHYIPRTSAEELFTVNPPIVTTVSKTISNDEIFYVGGKTELQNSQILIYLQNLRTGEVLSQIVQADRKGDWFYRHSAFLSPGNYLLWVQNKVGENVSPPSPQVEVSVQPTAIQFGATRISKETMYLVLLILFAAIGIGLFAFIVYHLREGNRKRQQLLKEVREAEEAVRRGFAVLRRDIEAELSVVRKMKLLKALGEEEKRREDELLRDLERVERYIGKEVKDIEDLRYGG